MRSHPSLLSQPVQAAVREHGHFVAPLAIVLNGGVGRVRLEAGAVDSLQGNAGQPAWGAGGEPGIVLRLVDDEHPGIGLVVRRRRGAIARARQRREAGEGVATVARPLRSQLPLLRLPCFIVRRVIGCEGVEPALPPASAVPFAVG